MDSGTTSIILKALDCLSVRSLVTAQNVANANTPGYRPMRVSFEQALAEAAQRGDNAVAQIAPQIDSLPADLGNGELRLDLELATSATTAQRYGGLINILDRQLQLQSLAIEGNVGGN